MHRKQLKSGAQIRLISRAHKQVIKIGRFCNLGNRG